MSIDLNELVILAPTGLMCIIFLEIYEIEVSWETAVWFTLEFLATPFSVTLKIWEDLNFTLLFTAIDYEDKFYGLFLFEE